MSTWIVTREWSDAEPLVQALRDGGLRARALPCIERTALPWPDDLAPPASRGPAGLEAGATPTIVLCTSPFAASLLIARWPRLVGAAGAAPLTCAAVAPVTARLLEAAGLPVSIRSKGGVASLAREVVASLGDGPRPCVLYPTSDRGDDSDEHAEALAVLAPRADVVGDVVYSTHAAPGLDAALRDLEPDAALLFFSPSAVTAFVTAASRAGVSLPATVVCFGGSTARAFARHAGREAIPAPRGANLVDFIRSLPESRP